VDGVNSFTCDCAAGFSGDTCDINVDDCASLPCRNKGVCVDGVDSFTCECADGFAGAICQTNINECNPDPCKNGATCVDGVNSFTCDCPAGYTGNTCNVNIDECSTRPCQNDGTCIDGIDSFTCECADGFSGDVCGIETSAEEQATVAPASVPTTAPTEPKSTSPQVSSPAIPTPTPTLPSSNGRMVDITIGRKSCGLKIPNVQLGQCSVDDLNAIKTSVITNICANTRLLPPDVVDVLFTPWYSLSRRTRRNGKELGILATVVFTTATPMSLIKDAVDLINNDIETNTFLVDVSVGGTVSTQTINEAVVSNGTDASDDNDAALDAVDYNASDVPGIEAALENADVEDSGGLGDGALVGIVVGGLVVLALVGAAVMLNRRIQQQETSSLSGSRPMAASYENAAYSPPMPTGPADPRMSRTSFSFGRGQQKNNPGFHTAPAWPTAHTVLQLATDSQPARVASVRRNSSIAGHTSSASDPAPLRRVSMTFGASNAATISEGEASNRAVAVNPRGALWIERGAEHQRRRSSAFTFDIDLDNLPGEGPQGAPNSVERRGSAFTSTDAKQRRGSSTSMV